MTYFSSKNIFDSRLSRSKRSLFKKITKKSPKLFLRGGDVISTGALLEGVHEKPLTNMIKYYVKNNLSDFFIDIGANIGLTSCQNGADFKRVVCFEPNRLCANILKTNLAISLPKGNFVINEFALGDADGSYELYVPKSNWGGAFIKSNKNSYSDGILASKDGYQDISLENYVVEKIEVRSTEKIFLELFSSLKSEGHSRGVIKIDVEGFEEVVLEGIGKTIPFDISVMIVFENWDENLNFDKIRSLFPNRSIKLKKLECTISDAKYPKYLKMLALIFGADKTHLVGIESAASAVGDVVIEVF